MKFERISACIILFAILFTLFACTNGQEAETDNTDAEETSADVISSDSDVSEEEITSEESTTGSQEETTSEQNTEESEGACTAEHEIVADGADGHYVKACDECGAEKGQTEAHEYPKTGEYKCTVCGFLPSCGRDHSKKWVREDDGHSMPRCEECGKAPVEKNEHTYESSGDGKYCIICKYNPKGDASWSASQFNKDIEHLVTDKKANELQFIHFADIHRGLTAWNRIVDYYNEYSEYFDFAIHSGDYVGAYNSPENNNYRDLYNEGTQSIKPIYNAVGNHDIYSVAGGKEKHDKSGVISTLFNKTDNWNVSFMGGSVNTSYCKDFPEQRVRLIVLDNYYDEAGQVAWLQELLDDAKAKGYHVITSMHEPTAKIVTPLDSSFNSLKPQASSFRTSVFDKILGDFIKDGGKYIANLTGHWHVDYIGYTSNGVLNISVEIGSAGAVGAEQLDGRYQFVGKRGYDAFNAVTVNADDGTFEIVRIGNNTDSRGREKTSLKFDYINKVIISENGTSK